MFDIAFKNLWARKTRSLLTILGVADPSVVLVATFKQLFRGTVTEAEIDAHLVKPFRGKNDEGEMNSARRSHI